MGYSDLSQDEMIEISSRWVTPEGTKVNNQEVPTVRLLIASYPLLREMLPLLEAAHQAVLVSTKKSVVAPPRLKEVRDRQTELDAIHDPSIKGIIGLLPALGELVREPTAKARLLELLQVLIPEGASRSNLSYRRESGAAKRMEARLSAEDKKLLAGVSIQLEGYPTIVLLQVVEELIAVGKELGILEDEKEALLNAPAPNPGGLTERDSINLWINHATIFVRLVGALQLSDEEEKRLVGALVDAEQKAVARKRETPTPTLHPSPNTPPSDTGV